MQSQTGSKSEGQRGKRRGRPPLTPQAVTAAIESQAPLPGMDPGDGPVSSTGIGLPLEAVGLPGDPTAGKLERTDPESEGPEETACKFCGKRFNRIATHEARCPQKPTVKIYLTEEGIAFVFDFAFGSVAATRGDHWKLKPDEKAALAQTWKAAIDALIPDIANSKWTVLALALTNTALVLLPRIQQDNAKRTPGASPNLRSSGDGQDYSAPASVV